MSSDTDAVRADIVSLLKIKWKMSIQIGKTWNVMAINYDSKTGILQMSMKRDIENMLMILESKTVNLIVCQLCQDLN